jgi:phospholipase D1/2
MTSLAHIESCYSADDPYDSLTLRHTTSPRPSSINFEANSESEGREHPSDTLPESKHISLPPSSLTPAARTGPPRSLSFSYGHTLPSSFSSPSYFSHDHGDILEQPRRVRARTHSGPGDDPHTHDPTPSETQFRGPFDSISAAQRDREREATDRRGKRRDSSRWDDFKSRWRPGPDSIVSSPTGGEEKSSGKDKERDDTDTSGGPQSPKLSSTIASGSGSGLSRSITVSTGTPDKGKAPERQDTQASVVNKSPSSGWSRLRFLLPSIASAASKESPASAVTPRGMNITDELTVGGLSVLMLRLWFERDEHDHRRVPILLHRLRIRVSDSLHPLHGGQTVFRIECEYANGAMRWVIYRQLRDFVSLHAHYAFSNAYNRNIDNLPEFPRTSRFTS